MQRRMSPDTDLGDMISLQARIKRQHHVLPEASREGWKVAQELQKDTAETNKRPPRKKSMPCALPACKEMNV